MTKLSSISASLMLLIASAAGSANAQSAQSIKVNIPFAFSFADKTFPAGNYSLFEPLQHFLVLRDARGATWPKRLLPGSSLGQPHRAAS
jgi:hypothetical protein